MIFIDTSVWIAYFRAQPRSIIGQVNVLLEEDEVVLAAPVWIELLSGAAKRDLGKIEWVLSALPRFYPTEETWQRMEYWIRKATGAGERFGMADLLIGALAAEQGAPLWSLDRDFDRMATLRFLRIYAPH